MRSLTLLFVIFCFFNRSFSQNFSCGDEKMKVILRQNNKDYDEQTRISNLKIKNYIDTHFSPNVQGRPTTTVYTIPVVFHIIHPSGQAYGTGANISYLQIQSQIDALNAAFAKNYPTYNGQSHPSYAQNTDIRFCLARLPAPATATFYTGPAGIEYGVRRYANTVVSNHQMGSGGMSALTALTHPGGTYFPFTDYLNIWVVADIASGGSGTIMGYATPPPASSAFDGIVMRANVTGDNSTGTNNFSLGYGLTQGKVMVHEVGHYLNLQHIFNGGCAGANGPGASTDACDLNGDYICDTEPCTTQNILCTQGIPNTCTANYATGTTNMDMIENYLSYADDDCMNTFTYNQSQRMWAALNTARFNLWQVTNLGLTGVSGPNGCNPAILFTNISTTGNCINSPIAVINPTAGNTASSWTWTAAGSSVPSANTPSISVTYATPGLKFIKLKVSDGTTTLMDSVMITVTNCSLDSTKLNRSNWLFGDFASVSFATGQPVPNNLALVGGPSPTIKCFENAVSMSDAQGNLLFYSNGRNLWNNNHIQVNTTPLLGWDLIIPSPNGYNGTSVGGFMSFPAPKKPNKYFIVCVPPYETKGQPTVGQFAKINYVIYDVASQTVTPFQMLTHPSINYVAAYPNFGLTENLNVVPHCNGIDYWIIARGTNPAGTGFYFYSFLVNENGLSPNTAPVLSGLYPLTQITQYGDMKSNMAGNKLVCKGKNKNVGYVWDFDQSTGLVTNPVALPTSIATSQTLTTAGIIYSPNNQYIYNTVTTNNTGTKIDMIDVANNTIVKTITPANGYGGDFYFEIGPDNIIYMTGWSNATGVTLAQLTNPDSAPNSTVSSYVSFAAVPNGKPNSNSILNFMEALKPSESSPMLPPVVVSCSTYSFGLDPCWKVYSPSWNFGDGSPVSTASNVTHTYASSGIYTVSLVLSYNGSPLPVYTKTISVSLSSPAIVGPTVICVGSTFMNSYGVNQVPGASYLWSASNATIAGPNNVSNISASGGTSGVATLSVQVTNGGCISSATKTINIVNLQVNLNASSTVVCTGKNVTLTGTPAGGTYSGTTNGNIFNSSLSGTFNVSYNYSNSGCYKSLNQSISVYNCTGMQGLTGQDWKISIYPNPNSGMLYLNSSVSVISYEIINPLGQVILIDKYEEGINTETLSNGIYFISVRNEAGEKVKLKFMKE
ncbi:MAG: M43 family zinc metalloprotease [Bacteroidota bacterium]